MFAIRLVHLIEEHADQLAAGLLRKLKESDACTDLMAVVPASELQNRAHEIYRNVADWFLNKSESEIEERYIGLGARRAHQGVPFSQMLFAIQTIKEYLWEFLRQEGLLEPAELIGEMEFLYLLERFFDRAAYFASVGYESARESELVHALSTHPAE